MRTPSPHPLPDECGSGRTSEDWKGLEGWAETEVPEQLETKTASHQRVASSGSAYSPLRHQAGSEVVVSMTYSADTHLLNTF
jgi:hypothetical protein